MEALVVTATLVMEPDQVAVPVMARAMVAVQEGVLAAAAAMDAITVLVVPVSGTMVPFKLEATLEGFTTTIITMALASDTEMLVVLVWEETTKVIPYKSTCKN